ncbi:hypothetical protein CR983_02085 [Candidatus Saccharibacteria bacterium]|nr:MAG: hypothetical protein CR983_02085 [Candidatus Saccharibacteria bacterium]
MTKTHWMIFIAICAAILGGLVWTSRSSRVDVSDIDAFRLIEASDANGNIADHIYTTPDSDVVVYEYADYQCPACQNISPIIKEAVEPYRDRVTLVFRNYPLPTLHPNARAAAAAAEAAGLQGKFWQMHKKLFADQNSWSGLGGDKRSKQFASYATQLGLDVEKFNADVASDAVRKKIDFDRALASGLNISGTPTIYVNDTVVDKSVKDGKLVPSGTEDSTSVVSSAELFRQYYLVPAMEEAGINTDIEQ